nr:putative RNA-dependent RNA polymerase [Picobirnavirus sp.]
MSYLDSVADGQPKVYTTPFAKGESTSSLLAAWKAELKSIATKWPSLYAFELDLAKKVGPLSVRVPLKQRIQDVNHYYEDILLPQVPISSRATDSVVREFSDLRGLTSRSDKSTIENMKLSTSSGCPYYRKRRTVLKDTYPMSQISEHVDSQNNLYYTQRLANSEYKMAAILGWRGQEGGPKPSDVKQRVVWMFPFSVNVKELSVYQPLIEGAQKHNLVPAWISNEEVDVRITNLFDSKRSSDLIVCTDFSKFDQHFNPMMQDAAKQVLEMLLHPRESDWLQNTFPVKYNIPLILQPDQIRVGRHGMGSGSGGTNCDETLAHRALQYEAAQLKGAELNPNSQCLGDDGILTYPGITVKDVVDAYTSHGLEMNTSKQYASTHDCVYLRRWHHKDYRVRGVCVGVYSTCRALGKMRYTERYQDPEYWDAKGVCLRYLSILENVKYHPLREQFVDFCMKRDKYRLGVDIPGFLDNIQSIAKEHMNSGQSLGSYMDSVRDNGNPIVGIANWWIVQYLKSK